MQRILRRYSALRPHLRKKVVTPASQKLSPLEVSALENKLESDRGRIINSAAVRRLQQKTQVFPLERNAAVRSRLTHSLEVQQTGRFITRTVFQLLRKQKQPEQEVLALERATETLVEMACLMHDIGNPPFGHFGEEIISRWFAEQLPKLAVFKQSLTENTQTQLRNELLLELQQFEGNAQAIRLVFSLQKLNLTYLQSACVLKYTRCATQPKPEASHPLSYLQKKPGFYFSEKKFIEDLWQELDLQPGHRFALSYLMEAADDISYCLADIEDSVDKGILSYTELAKLLKEEFAQQYSQDPEGIHFKGSSFNQLVDEALEAARLENYNKDHAFFVRLRVKLVHPLVEHAAQAFVDNLSQVADGSLNKALLEDDSPCHALISTLKQVAFKHVFNVSEVTTLMLQGHRIITGLLDFYLPLLELPRADFSQLVKGERVVGKSLFYEALLADRMPRKHLKAYQLLCASATELGAGKLNADTWELYCRCRLLQDMISGMTDQYALDEYQVLAATH
ncbi:MAG: dGTPase [Pseudomonadaceae bacterium]|nr:dGTPase [Pseudomonadaceae bacterium]